MLPAAISRFSPLKPGSRVKLDRIDPSQEELFPAGKRDSKHALHRLGVELSHLQKVLYAEHKHKVLLVLQGMDTSGKNGTIRHVFGAVNPQGVTVASFKRPTPIELDHDYLWRVHQVTPAKGEIVIFDRSHYEEVTAVRVQNLMPKTVWSKRFEHINAFEKMLADEGTTIVKFLLHIDLDEQKRRLESRLLEPEKNWKFEPSDIKAREQWNDYMGAYDDVLRLTNTPYAPWYVIPSNHKWLRNLIVASVLVRTLKKLRMRYPKINFNPEEIKIP